MTIDLRRLLLASAAFALSACGGGGTEVGFIPPPPPPAPPVLTPPPPTTAANYIVAATSGSTDYTTQGGFVSYNSASGQSLGTSIAQGDLSFRIRYDAGAGQYQIELPASTFWEGLSLTPGQVPNTSDFHTADVTYPTYLQLQEYAGTGYTYSALALWSAPGSEAGLSGGVAFGIPTPAGAVPTTGSATFNGSITGRTTQSSFDSLAGNYWPALVEGSINLSFNFGAGTLAGSLSPTIYDVDRRALAPLNFINTVYAKGSTIFSGSFDTNLTGTSSFSGQFTGPQAQELVGSFAFPYAADGKTFQATGAFVGKQ